MLAFLLAMLALGLRLLTGSASPDRLPCLVVLPSPLHPNASPPWWNVFQWKSKRDGTNDPIFSLDIGNGRDGSLYFYLYSPNAKESYSQAFKNVPEGQWFRVEAFYRIKPAA